MLGVLAAAWFLLGIHVAIVGAVAALIVITWLVPQRYSNVVAGLGMIAIGAFFYLQFAGGTRAGLLTGLVGLIYLTLGIADLRRK
jgi:thiamine transporter ThiT